ncbi:ArsR family transcriptional regulator [Natrinema sp. 1APR25-10V2]|uniref:DUF7344 domain-containing protein n=1 Tax=Natrinema sp. 1APR25-10V2 TaxID=2951081 RepID=UPI00287495B0|nr:ArsR family transcriptional regulator [Natrinema sp. 1APR25-10V2]MDS0477387.1 ArsR family transcriptional regulator [Natrinema sp. 1APR25-10V2]
MDTHEDEVIRLLAERRNRAILSVLNDAARSLTVTELVQRLIASETVESDAATDETDYQREKLSLHHTELPRLDEVGLIDYDPEANVVSYETYPSVSAEWLELEMIDELLSCFESAATDDTVGVIEGREDVIEYGRYLVEEADEELFCMFVGADLFEDECVRSAQNAIERGVAVSMGTHDPAVRELARTRLPEATVWEPQLDWLNDGGEQPTVGRIVFADREQLMIALVDDTAPDGTAERAIVGDGANNPLIVLVRELLGPRLDHLDYQSEDLLDALPFEP